MSNPLVSVLISAYNHENYVEKAIDSIMTQTYHPIELIVVDDGSPDRTFETMKSAHKKWDGSFICEMQSNKGANLSYNALIQRSKGRYLNLFSSDDWMLPDKIKTQVHYLENHPEVGMVYSDGFVYDQNKDSYSPHPWVRKTHPSGWIFQDLLTGNFIPAVSNLIRRECFDRVGLLDPESSVHDWDLWLRIAREFQIHYVDAATVVYRVHGNNSTNFMPIKLLEGERSLFTKYCQDPLLLAKHLKRISLHELSYYSIRDRRIARRMLRENSRYWFTPIYLKSAFKFTILSLMDILPSRSRLNRSQQRRSWR
jgi:glycosyltransferase involved in cell wall biosynthesis